MQDDLYTLPLGLIKSEGGDLQQYCSLYYKRLDQLKPAVKEAAELKWSKFNARYMDNILDIKPGELTVIIGTFYKE